MSNIISKQRIVLIVPNSRWYNKRPFQVIPYSALILTALLKNDFDFSIIDANGEDLSEGQVLSELKAVNPSVAMVSGTSAEYYRHSHTVLYLVKSLNPECITVMGGAYPTVMGEEIIKDPNVDYIFMGHAEERVNDFLRAILDKDFEKINRFPGIGFKDNAGCVVLNPVATYISDVKKMVKPDYSKISAQHYLDQNTHDWNINSRLPAASIITTYGCPYNCVFCATRTISGRKIVVRPLEDIIEEIEYLINIHGIKDLIFLDDNISYNRRHFIALLNTFIDRSYNIAWKAAGIAVWDLDDELLELMKKSGCTRICISAESGSQRVLKKIIRKPVKLEKIPGIVEKCKDLGIEILSNFVIGLPGETWDELRETFRYADACDFDVVHFHIATPLPKTDLYNMAKEQNLLPSDFNFTNPKSFGWGQGFIITDHFTPFDLMVLRAFEWDRINFSSPEKISKVADIYSMTVAELNDHRKQTIKKLGLHC